MRKQYYFRPSSRGLLAWDVDRLVLLSRDFPVRAVALTEIAELHAPLVGDEHARLIDEADLIYPIILAANDEVMDGRHRLAKALREGRATIDAVQFTEDPPPDYVGRDPDDLPYD
jgi:hypothetical protein